jgi:hypothetical protein
MLLPTAKYSILAGLQLLHLLQDIAVLTAKSNKRLLRMHSRANTGCMLAQHPIYIPNKNHQKHLEESID